MSQPVTSSRLTNSAVNIIGANAGINTNFGLTKIGVTGNNFDISSSGSGTVTLGITGSGNVQIGNATSGTVTFPGVTTFTQAVSGGTFSATAINGTTSSTAMTIGSNLINGSISIGATASNNTITIGSNGAGATGTVNVGTSSANINIGSTAASAIVIGNAAGTITLKSPLTLANGGILGEGVESVAVTTTLPVAINTILSTVTLTPGTWILSGNVQFMNAPDSFLTISVNTVRDPSAAQNGYSTGVVSINVTRMYSGGAITFNLVGYSSTGGITSNSVRFIAYRIG